MFLFLKIGTTFLFCQHFHFFHDNRIHRSVLEVGSYGTDLPYYIHAFHDFAKNGMVPVKPGRGSQRDEELAAAGIGTGIGHGKDAFAVVGQPFAELIFDPVARAPSMTR